MTFSIIIPAYNEEDSIATIIERCLAAREAIIARTMVDEVEAGEPLPVFLDERFVNWDPHRTAGGVEVLRDLGPDRQAFLFTADPDWAERACARINARVVETPPIAD